MKPFIVIETSQILPSSIKVLCAFIMYVTNTHMNSLHLSFNSTKPRRALTQMILSNNDKQT